MRPQATDVQFDKDLAGLPREVVDTALRHTSEHVQKFVISDDKASYYQYGGSIARTLVAFYAGRSVGWALDVTADESYMVGGIAAVGLVLVWSMLQKKWAAWRTNQAARASATASAVATQSEGSPVAVPLEPPPNKV